VFNSDTDGKNIRWRIEIIESERSEIPEIPTTGSKRHFKCHFGCHLNGTEKAVYAVLKQKPDSSREEIAEMILCVKLLKNKSFTHIMC
jgi:hypothetical protein